MTVWEARNLGIKQLKESQNASSGCITFPTQTLDIDCLLSYVLEKDRSYLIAHNQDFILSDDEEAFFELVKKRTTGTPIAYLIGKKEFYGFDFIVTPDVLIPKPDTELLVEKSLEVISPYLKNPKKSFVFADVCTGSGCVALSILKTLFASNNDTNALSCLTAYCTDISKEALDVAHKNALSLLTLDEQDCIRFFQGDLLEPLEGSAFDLIVSNPPYIPSNIVEELLKDGRSEPRLALDGDVGDENSKDGLSVVRRLVEQSYKLLKSGGCFLVETGEYNAKETLLLMEKAGFVDLVTYNDLSGQPRVSYGKKL